ncbi:hypothetical protein Zmor_008206 [Zophobas morio]|uniref:Uncharacterized protein n=1 Tax=Zophobas morio TaxID=2755281 RepID=A0AA38MQK3_9CUCU|nr:hypothetical protein Zmor_008206 [Zophobas morio]
MIVPPIYYFLYITDICKEQNFLCFLAISDRIFIAGIVFVAITDLKNIKPHQDEFDSWLYIFENRKSFKLGNLIQASFFRRFKFLRIFSFGIIIVNMFSTSFSYFTLSGKIQTSIPLQILRSYYYLVQQRNIGETLKHTSLLGTVLKSFEESLKTCLVSSSNLEPTFRKYQNLIRRINGTISLFLEQMAIGLFVWGLISVIFLVLNFYILLKYEDYDVYVVSLIHLRLFYAIYGIVITLIQVEEDINKKVRLM